MKRRADLIPSPTTIGLRVPGNLIGRQRISMKLLDIFIQGTFFIRGGDFFLSRVQSWELPVSASDGDGCQRIRKCLRKDVRFRLLPGSGSVCSIGFGTENQVRPMKPSHPVPPEHR